MKMHNIMYQLYSRHKEGCIKRFKGSGNIFRKTLGIVYFHVYSCIKMCSRKNNKQFLADLAWKKTMQANNFCDNNFPLGFQYLAVNLVFSSVFLVKIAIFRSVWKVNSLSEKDFQIRFIIFCAYISWGHFPFVFKNRFPAYLVSKQLVWQKKKVCKLRYIRFFQFLVCIFWKSFTLRKIIFVAIFTEKTNRHKKINSQQNTSKLLA